MVTLPVRHYYHVYAAGAWIRPAQEHVTALALSGLRAPMVIGLVGAPGGRLQAREMLTAMLSEAGLPAPERWAEADEGWEQVTLAEVHADVHRTPAEFAVMYAHAKGSANPSPLNAAWRRSMTRHVACDWEECAGLLEDGYDTAGCHWVTAQRSTTAFYAGNFWWARASYLRTLPPPPNESRWQAETWVSSATGPKAADLLPGWPRYTQALA